MATSVAERRKKKGVTPYLMALGQYRFAVATASFETLSRSTSYNWSEQKRLRNTCAFQYQGRGSDEITLNGVVYPHFQGGVGQVAAMRKEAESGKPLSLMDGTGKSWGRWVIREIEETRTLHSREGIPRKVSFRLRLAWYGEEGRA